MATSTARIFEILFVGQWDEARQVCMLRCTGWDDLPFYGHHPGQRLLSVCLPAVATWCPPPKSSWATMQGDVTAGGRAEGCPVHIMEPLCTPLSEKGPATLVPLRAIL